MFKKILVAIDGSNQGNKALDSAIAIAQGAEGELHIMHVIKNDMVPSYVLAELSTISFQVDFIEVARKHGDTILELAAEKAKQAKLTTYTHLLEGDPARMISSFAEEHDMDLIVLGSRGLTQMKEWMLGSVSHRVSQYAEKPILIVK
ncbi:universal stress protein [Rubeoparvulum massiliense]|uniref:universal stress protein n=1 Tax=Rubeoparvulum massiliense TaxID=1631346 RepID=UPI00065E65FA|nr:universal stress protein [Rubeoparvulum massiliense]